MKRKEKAERIQNMLEELYPEIPVPLDHETPFQLLIAVLMSAQTTDLKVNQVTPELFRQGPTPEKMASLEVAHIQSMIREVGLAPTKAKNIKRLSELLLERHGGEIPSTFEELEDQSEEPQSCERGRNAHCFVVECSKAKHGKNGAHGQHCDGLWRPFGEGFLFDNFVLDNQGFLDSG